MSKFRKKPVVIDAFRWTGDEDQTEDPEWIIKEIKAKNVVFVKTETHVQLQILTLEGIMIANPGDFVIRGVQGEIYPCKPDIFEMTYEPV